MKRVLIFVGVLYILVFAGCGGSGESGSSPAPAQKDTTQAAQETLSVGKSASLGNGLIVTVTNARRVDRDSNASGAQPQRGEVWAVVDFTVENAGQRTVTVSSANWTAMAYVGDLLQQAPEAVPTEGTPEGDWAGKLEPGQKREGSVAFITLRSDSVLLQFRQEAGEYTTLARWDLGPIKDLERTSL